MTPGPRLLRPTEAGRLLESAVAAIRAELAALPDDVLAWHPALGEWCAKEVLGHLIESEGRGFAGRIRITTTGITSVRCWRTSRPSHGHTWAMLAGSPRSSPAGGVNTAANGGREI